jgi:hypothetical protein
MSSIFADFLLSPSGRRPSVSGMAAVDEADSSAFFVSMARDETDAWRESVLDTEMGVSSDTFCVESSSRAEWSSWRDLKSKDVPYQYTCSLKTNSAHNRYLPLTIHHAPSDAVRGFYLRPPHLPSRYPENYGKERLISFLSLGQSHQNGTHNANGQKILHKSKA